MENSNSNSLYLNIYYSKSYNIQYYCSECEDPPTHMYNVLSANMKNNPKVIKGLINHL